MRNDVPPTVSGSPAITLDFAAGTLLDEVGVNASNTNSHHPVPRAQDEGPARAGPSWYA